MRILLLGTGAADGIPNAFCICPTCREARTSGQVRTRSGVLVDGVILIDPGPDCAAQASRAGVGLADVAHILITHNHPDHLDPSHLLARSWVSQRPLAIHAPQAALDAIAPWLAPDSPVELLSLKAGQTRNLTVGEAEYELHAVAAEHSDLSWTPGVDDGSAVLFDLTGPATGPGTESGTGPDRSRLLYMADTAPVGPEVLDDLASRGRADLILLEETFGTKEDHRTGHHDLKTFAATCAELRRRGIAGRIVPVHMSHHNPPKPELEQIMQGWGVELNDDLAELELGDPLPLTPAPRRTLVTGGARSGKSHWAEQSVLASPEVRYIATAPPRPGDAEWEERVRLHKGRRPAHWTTVESADLVAALGDPTWDRPAHATVVDCLSLWLTDVLDKAEAWESTRRGEAFDAAEQQIERLQAAVRGYAGTLVVVTNEVGSGVVPATYAGRIFADLLGITNRRIAAACDSVVLVTAGIPQTIKGSEPEGTS